MQPNTNIKQYNFYSQKSKHLILRASMLYKWFSCRGCVLVRSQLISVNHTVSRNTTPNILSNNSMVSLRYFIIRKHSCDSKLTAAPLTTALITLFSKKKAALIGKRASSAPP